MQRKIILSGLLGLLFVLTAGAERVSAQGNFAGRWSLDKSRSTNLGPISDISLNVTQSGRRITVNYRITTSQGVHTPKDVFVLNGVAQDVMLEGPGGASGKGKRTSKKINGGFENFDEGTFKPERFPEAVTVRTTRRWLLSSDGKTLTLEIARKSNFGAQNSRRIFTRQ